MTIPTDPNASWEGTLPPESYPKYSLIKYGWESNIVNPKTTFLFIWLVVYVHIWIIFATYWECHPNSQNHIFRRGCSTTNQFFTPKKVGPRDSPGAGPGSDSEGFGAFHHGQWHECRGFSWENRWESRLENVDFSQKSWELISKSSDLTGQGHCFGHGGQVLLAKIILFEAGEALPFDQIFLVSSSAMAFSPWIYGDVSPNHMGETAPTSITYITI